MKRLFLLLILVPVLLAALPREAGGENPPIDKYQCLSCHSKQELLKVTGRGEKISLYVDAGMLAASAHRYVDCTTCHTTQPHDPNAPLTKLSLAEKCSSCHQFQGEQHRESIHGQQLLQGNVDVATCVDCHSAAMSPHGVNRVLSPESTAYRKNIAGTCARCHGDQKLMSRYGIVEKIYESYMRTFHGKAMRLAPYELTKLNTATCTNCHGTHNIKKADDPTAPVASLTNLAQTCERCHPGAGENYASSFMGHKEASLESFPAVYLTERFFLVFTALVVTFGILVVTLEMTRRFIKGS